MSRSLSSLLEAGEAEDANNGPSSLFVVGHLALNARRATKHVRNSLAVSKYFKSQPISVETEEGESYPLDFVKRGFCSPGDARNAQFAKAVLTPGQLTGNLPVAVNLVYCYFTTNWS